jgi:transcriptional regulator with XRE-family HTH domain
MKGGIMMNISEKLRKLRLKTKKTLKEVSKAVNVSLNTVYRWEHDLSVPRKSVLKKVADYYDVPFEWLLNKSANEDDVKVDSYILDPDNETEYKVMKMMKGLSENTKHRILGYIERIYTENENL